MNPKNMKVKNEIPAPYHGAVAKSKEIPIPRSSGALRLKYLAAIMSPTIVPVMAYIKLVVPSRISKTVKFSNANFIP